MAQLPRVVAGPARAIAPDRVSLDACAGSAGAADRGIAEWLCLAVAPVCALMALYVGVFDGSASGAMSPAMHPTSPLGGMAPMYLLMGLFHAAPWVRLISSRRRRGRTARRAANGLSSAHRRDSVSLPGMPRAQI